MSNRVRATAKGFYGGAIREEGATFDIASKGAFSKHWMEWVEKPDAAATPEDKSDAKADDEPVSENKTVKKFRLAPKVFKNEAGNREVPLADAIEAAMTDLKVDADKWNELEDGQRREATQRAAKRMLTESMA